MAYMNQDKKKIIKANLDNALKGTGIKYSLRVRDNLAIACTIRSAPIDFIDNFVASSGDSFATLNGLPPKYLQVNKYWYTEHFSGAAADILGKIIDCLHSAGWYDKSDAMVDYFDTAYYIDLNIGSWDKPFIVTKGV